MEAGYAERKGGSSEVYIAGGIQTGRWKDGKFTGDCELEDVRILSSRYE